MRYLTALLITTGLFSNLTVLAQSSLLEGVKRNPSEARALCKKFQKYNAAGISTSSNKVIEELSRQKNLSPTDAEVLSIYVIGMYCPDVK